MSYTSEPFDPDHHDVSGFDCGEESLNTWLREQAGTAEVRRTARTWVWVDQDGSIAGYYALASHRVRREEVPSRIGRGGPEEIPAVLLARLALDQRLRGQQLGPVLVADALTRIVAASRIVAARLVVVDALHEKVAGFYEQLGFRRVPGSLTLVLKISDAEAAIEHAN
ncbi:MAG: GNAT family N-acetyltransferase [Nocardioides sp.]|uniref:GNAT family N-acetyltransferase n=1 Tax=Nocardioides sp. TaxID=35761 RepID=UPI0039E3C98E